MDSWISISKKRPPNKKLVILTNEVDNWVVAGERINKKYFNQFEHPFEPEIYPTHWMPLPKPINFLTYKNK